MSETDVWMLGVVAFGCVFYLCALYFQSTAEQQSDDQEP